VPTLEIVNVAEPLPMLTFGVTLPQLPDVVKIAKSPVLAPLKLMATESVVVALAGLIALT
jgi:hypothetical protein